MRRWSILLLAFAPGVAAAHTLAPQPGWQGPEPWMLAPMLLTAGLYAVGYARLRARSDHGRPERAALILKGVEIRRGSTRES